MSGISWLSLIILWLAYALLGWYLAAHQIIWQIGTSIALLSLAVGWKSSLLLRRSLNLSSQGLFVVIIAGILISILVTSAITWINYFSLFFIPCIATMLVQVELSFVGCEQVRAFFFLTLVAGCGLLIGEIVDLTLFSPQEY